MINKINLIFNVYLIKDETYIGRNYSNKNYIYIFPGPSFCITNTKDFFIRISK